MKARRPYLLRALHEWICDSAETPHIVVDATQPGVLVPKQFVKDGKIVLNVSHSAAHRLNLGNEAVSFQARFGGVSQAVDVPMRAVIGIYARESGQGMIFPEGDFEPSPTPPAPPAPPASTPEKRPRLKVVK